MENIEKKRARQHKYGISDKGRARRRRADARYKGSVKGLQSVMRRRHARREAAIEREVAAWL